MYKVSSAKLTCCTCNESTLSHQQSCLGACGSLAQPATTRPPAAAQGDSAAGGLTPMWTRCMVNSESQHGLKAILRQNKLLGNINKDIYCK